VSNPVAFFPQDNNGVILQLPAIAANGAASAAGRMVFGIGTQENNKLAATVIDVPGSGAMAGTFNALYGGTGYPNSMFDSGSSGLYFDDAGIPICPSNSPAGDLSSYFCPGTANAPSAIPINVTITGSNGLAVAVSVSVANAQFLFTQADASSLNAFASLAGPAGATLPGAFDFGVPFFFGKAVFTAFEQRSPPNGAGPYYAFEAYP
jgi:hypothetical protein